MGWSEATDPAPTEAVEAAGDSQPPGNGAALCCCPLPKNRVLLMATYAAGLRVGEVIALKPTDLDSHRLMIRVEQSKGSKDPKAFSLQRLEELRIYWQLCRPIPSVSR